MGTRKSADGRRLRRLRLHRCGRQPHRSSAVAGGPRVRIHLPPAASPLRTLASEWLNPVPSSGESGANSVRTPVATILESATAADSLAVQPGEHRTSLREVLHPQIGRPLCRVFAFAGDTWPERVIAADLLHKELGAGGVHLVAEASEPIRMHRASAAACFAPNDDPRNGRGADCPAL
jgi:hypothetical protein